MSHNNDEQRVILHCDMDAFYAQVEQVRLQLPVSTPIAVQQWHSLIASNYAARACGVKRGQLVTLARSMCPELVAVHVPTYRLGEGDGDRKTIGSGILGQKESSSSASAPPTTGGKYRQFHNRDECKVSLSSYRNASRRVFEVLSQFGQVEKASIDEAYIAVQCGLDQLDDDECRRILDAGVHVAGGCAELKSLSPTDKQLIYGIITAQKIRQRVLEVCNYTISIGVARTKSVAKLLSSMHKPDKCSVIFDDDLMAFMADVPFQKIGSLGGKFGSDILKQLVSGQPPSVQASSSAGTVSDPLGSDSDNDDLQQRPPLTSGDVNVKCKDLFHVSRARFAEIGAAEVYDIIRGQYHQDIEPKSHLKSMLSAKTFSANKSVTFELAQNWLALLTRELWERMSEEYEISKRWPRSLVLQGQLESGKVIVGKTVSAGRLSSQLELFNKLSKQISNDNWKTYIRRLTVSATNFTNDRDIVELFQFVATANSFTSRQDEQSIRFEKDPNDNYQESEWQTVDVLSKKLNRETVPAIFKCERCLETLYRDQLNEHIDYHVALKLYKQDNPRATARPKALNGSSKVADDEVIVIPSSSDDEIITITNPSKGKRKCSTSPRQKKRQLALSDFFS